MQVSANRTRMANRWSRNFDVQWSISDFKSVEHATVDMSVGHLSSLTGTNSAGKSSLIQSILLLCQSINNGEGIVLNGPLTRLGLPEDVVRFGADAFKIELSFHVPQVDNMPLARYRDDTREDNHVASSSYTLAPFSDPRNTETNVIRIKELKLELLNGGSASFTFLSSGDERERVLHSIRNYGGGSWLFENFDLVRLADSSEGDNEAAYVLLNGFDPEFLIATVSGTRALEIRRREFEEFVYTGVLYGLQQYAGMIHRELDKMIGPESFQDTPDKTKSLGGSQAPVSGRERLQNRIAQLTEEQKHLLVETLANKMADNPRTIVFHLKNKASIEDRRRKKQLDPFSGLYEISRALADLSTLLGEIAQSVAYIGPLRDEPRVVSPLTEESNQNLPIGAKGERTATVLLNAKHREVLCRSTKEGSLEYTNLGSAVSSWARYLGVADSVDSLSMQKLGVRLVVRSGNDADLDFTQVGVGVSQAIPLLVGILSVSPGSTVIIEQPELHLHPSAQAKFADFLLFVRDDISYVIETHSEALVTRIRRRVVEAKTKSENISILFFEGSEGHNGVKSHKLEMNEYGNLEAWPKGFMDAVQEDSKAIMLEVAKRRRASRGE